MTDERLIVRKRLGAPDRYKLLTLIRAYGDGRYADQNGSPNFGFMSDSDRQGNRDSNNGDDGEFQAAPEDTR